MSAVRRPHRTLGIVVASVAAMVLAGCSFLARPPFEVTLPPMNAIRPLPVRLIDHSNTITALEVPVRGPDRPADLEGDEFALAVPGRPNAVFVAWLGGMCDEQVDVEFTGGDRTFTVTTTEGQGGCRLAGIGRSVIVAFASPVDASSFTVQQLR